MELLDVTPLTEVEQMSKISFLASQAMLFVLFSDLAKPIYMHVLFLLHLYQMSLV